MVLVAKEAAMRPLRRLMAQLDALDEANVEKPPPDVQADMARSVATRVGGRAGCRPLVSVMVPSGPHAF